MWKNKTVSLIFPTYNEKDSIREAIVEFESSGYIDEIIVVNNNAAVGTSEEIHRAQSRITREVHELKQGYGHAIQRGFMEASGDLLIVSEPDGTFVGRDIVKLLAYSDDFDVVYGSRTAKELIWEGANMGLFLRWGNFAVAKMMEFLFNTTNLTDVGCTLRLIHRIALERMINQFTVGREHFGPEMMMLSFINRSKVIQIPINYTQRVGTSSVTGDLKKAARLGLVMIALILKYRFKYLGAFHLHEAHTAWVRVKNEVKEKTPVKPFGIPWVYFLCAGHFIYFFGLMYLRWRSYTPSMDYHAYVQMLFNSINGEFLVYNQGRAAQVAFFKLHFAPFLAIPTAAYAILAHPLTLYAIFAAFISAMLLPLYRMARTLLQSLPLALLFAICAALYPPLMWNEMQGFCEEAFAASLITFAFYFLWSGKYTHYTLLSILTLSLRINMTIPIGMLGLYGWWFKGRREGLFLSVLSAIWLGYIILFITPRFTPPNTMPYIYGYFDVYGKTGPDIVKGMLTNPSLVWTNITDEKKITYLTDLFLPLLGLPLLSPTISLLVLPILGINVLASITRLSSIYSYYSASIIPFLLIATLFSIAKLNRGIRGIRIPSYLSLLSLFFFLIYLNRNYNYGRFLTFSTAYTPNEYEIPNITHELDAFVENIPINFSIGTHDRYVESLAARRWYFDQNTYTGYLPDLLFVDILRDPSTYQKLAHEQDWKPVASSILHTLYARKELILPSSTQTLASDLQKYPADAPLIAILGDSMNPYSVKRDVGESFVLFNKAVLAQYMPIENRTEPYLQITLSKVPYPVSRTREYITNIIKPPRGTLEIALFPGDIEGPYLDMKPLSRTVIPAHTLTTAFDVRPLQLPKKIDSHTWLIARILLDDGKTYQKFQAYRIYLTGRPTDYKTICTDTDLASPHPLIYTSDPEDEWSADLCSREILALPSLREYPEGTSRSRSPELLTGQRILSGNPQEILDTLPNYKRNDPITLVGLPRTN